MLACSLCLVNTNVLTTPVCQHSCLFYFSFFKDKSGRRGIPAPQGPQGEGIADRSRKKAWGYTGVGMVEGRFDRWNDFCGLLQS